MVDAVRLRRDLGDAGALPARCWWWAWSRSSSSRGRPVAVGRPAAGLSVAALVTASSRARLPLVLGILLSTFLRKPGRGPPPEYPGRVRAGSRTRSRRSVVSTRRRGPGAGRPELGNAGGPRAPARLHHRGHAAARHDHRLDGVGSERYWPVPHHDADGDGVPRSRRPGDRAARPCAADPSHETAEGGLELVAQSAATAGQPTAPSCSWTGQRLPIMFLVMPALAWGALRASASASPRGS